MREVRLGRHPQNTTRIVVDMEGVDSYSVFTLYSPFRLVIDFKPPCRGSRPGRRRPVRRHWRSRRSPPPPGPTRWRCPRSVPVPPLPPPVAATPPPERPVPPSRPGRSATARPPLPSRPVVPASPIPPAVPAANSNGKFSLARQLGLGVSRIVIDAGHGGHDPGAHGNGINEAELVLDVALRLSSCCRSSPASKS